MQKTKSQFDFGFEKAEPAEFSILSVSVAFATLSDQLSMRTAQPTSEVQTYASEVESQYIKFHPNLHVDCFKWVVN